MLNSAIQTINAAMVSDTVDDNQMIEGLKALKVFDVCTGKYEHTDQGVEENYKTSHSGLTIVEALALFDECKGYHFRRIEFAGTVIAEGC